MKEIIERYTSKYHRKIGNYCAPLVECLHIPVFTYFRITADGHFVTLGNFPEQLEFYYADELFQSNPYLVDPALLTSGCVLTAHTPDVDYQETIERSKRKFHLDNTFLMIETCGDVLEGFFYGTQNQHANVSSLYLSRLDRLKTFNRYFVREASSLIKKMEGEGFNMKKAKGEAFSARSSNLPLAKEAPEISAFLKRISPLSKRERECLELFRKGFSAQGTAAKLNLSKRTVEHYFDNIKEKLGCQSKWDLLLLG